MEDAPYLKNFLMSKSLNFNLRNIIFYFNRQLEHVYLTGNSLNYLPKFCQFCLSRLCRSNLLLNNECRLKKLYFDSNNLSSLLNSDLSDLNNLEYLNLNNNSLSFLESNSLTSLIKLETLILSENRLKNCSCNELFSKLSNLKLLNLSSNLIEILSRNFLSQLYKLETVDLSFNKIYALDEYSFNNLLSLRNLYLNENSPSLLIHNESFSHLDSIQNIFISKSILLRNESKTIFIDLFKVKNANFFKRALNRDYFKSLFLIAAYDTYDCQMALFFMRNNVHFNFKTERDIFDYFSECSLLVIKAKKINQNDEDECVSSNRNLNIFSNGFLYFGWLTLLFILILLGFYLCV